MLYGVKRSKNKVNFNSVVSESSCWFLKVETIKLYKFLKNLSGLVVHVFLAFGHFLVFFLELEIQTGLPRGDPLRGSAAVG